MVGQRALEVLSISAASDQRHCRIVLVDTERGAQRVLAAFEDHHQTEERCLCPSNHWPRAVDIGTIITERHDDDHGCGGHPTCEQKGQSALGPWSPDGASGDFAKCCIRDQPPLTTMPSSKQKGFICPFCFVRASPDRGECNMECKSLTMKHVDGACTASRDDR